MFKNRVTSWLLGLSLVASLLTFITPQAQATTAPTCSTSNFSITPNYNPTFYQVSASVTSTYVEYVVRNIAAGSGTYYARIESFVGGKVALASSEIAGRNLGSLSNGSTSSAYWYLTSSGTTSTAQTHDVVIYSDSGYTTPICKINSGFTSVDRTIAANANKLTSVVNDALPSVGGDFNVTVKGQTGTIGAGPSGDYDVNLTPATENTFPANKFQLKGVSYTCGGTTVSGKLWVRTACQGNYTAVFTFTYLTSAGASSPTSPVMQIASGSQMKHTSTPSFTITAIGAAPLPYTLTIGPESVTVTSAILYGQSFNGILSAKFCYVKSNSTVTSFSSCTNAVTATGSEASGWRASISGLTSGTYYYEIWGYTASAFGGTLYKGGVISFVTPSALVSELTDAASSITGTTAVLNGHQVSNTSGLTMTCSFAYSTTNPASGHFDPLNDALIAASGTPSGYTLSISNLTIATTYYYELLCSDSNGSVYYYGGVQSFTTLNPVMNTLYFDATTGLNFDGNETITVTNVPSGVNGLSSTYRPTSDPTQAGKVFLGWTKDGATVITSDTVSGNTIYLAKWANVSTFLITYDALGTYWADSTDTKTVSLNTGQDAIANQPGTSLSRPGYYFHGWSATNGGTTPLSTYSVSGAATLYAIWVQEFVITWNANGGTFASAVTDTETVPNGEDAFNYIPASAPTWAAHTFLGYAETNSATTAISSYVISGAKTFYAVWSAATIYSVTFDANLGTGTMAIETSTVAANLTSNAFTRSGYTFGGWATSSGSTTVAYSNGASYPFNADITLYAIWIVNTPPAAPVTPVIGSLSTAKVCASGDVLVVNGINLLGAQIDIDGYKGVVIDNTSTQVTFAVPVMSPGVKLLKVITPAGQSSISLTYTYSDVPVFKVDSFPQLYKNLAYSYSFAAENADSYQLLSNLPGGLTFDLKTGLMSGTPSVTGDFVVYLVANNACGGAVLEIQINIDKEIPHGFTCSVTFQNANTTTITPSRLSLLSNCLSGISSITPRTLEPTIVLSGGVPNGATPGDLASNPRYNEICELLLSLNIPADVMAGLFNIPGNTIEITIYWELPNYGN